MRFPGAPIMERFPPSAAAVPVLDKIDAVKPSGIFSRIKLMTANARNSRVIVV